MNNLDSPDEVLFQQLITIDRKNKTAIYIQIANQIVNAIQRKYLLVGYKLPGTRQLSEILGVNRNTIVAALDELEIQAWIQKVPHVGCYILSTNLSNPQRIINKNFHQQSVARQSGYNFIPSAVLEFETNNTNYSIILNDGKTDERITNFDWLSRKYASYINRLPNTAKPEKEHKKRQNNLKSNMANYLNLSRGLHIAESNICLTPSLEMCIYLVAQILLKPNDIVVVAELSYYIPNMIFTNQKAKILTIPTDKDGILVDALEDILKNHSIRMLYLTPHHHYPTTVTLSAPRRVKLLELSRQYGFVILEDDYDYEFHYDRYPLLPLASADQNGMVIYVGSFAKSLLPSFTKGFIVATEDFIREAEKYVNLLYHDKDRYIESVLNEMIVEGDMHRFIKKNNKVYRERRNLCCQLLKDNLANDIDFIKPNGGLAVWLQWKKQINLMKLKQNAQTYAMDIPTTILYQNKKTTAMRLGFGDCSEEEMFSIIDILKKSIPK